MAHDGEDFDPTDYRRYDLISKIFHHGISDATFDSVNTEDATINTKVTWPDGSSTTTSPGGGTADYEISSLSALKDTINTQLSQGDHVFIEQPATPYQLDAWLEIDVSDVTVEFASPYAADGNQILSAADGGSNGGFRVGANAAVTDVRFENIGFYGNRANTSGNHRDAIQLRDVERCWIVGGHIENTGPQQHGQGGDGVAALSPSADVYIDGLRLHDIGDRSIETAATRTWIQRCHITGSYDRPISLQTQSEPMDGNDYESRDVAIRGCMIGPTITGSAIAHNNGTAGSTGRNYSITNCTFYGDHDRGVRFRGTSYNVSITNCTFLKENGTANNEAGISIDGALKNFSVGDCTVEGYDAEAVYVGSNNAENFTISNITGRDCGGDGAYVLGKKGTLTGLVMKDMGGKGVYSEIGQGVVTDCHVTNAAAENFHFAQTGTPTGVGYNVSHFASGGTEFLIDNNYMLIVANLISGLGNNGFEEGSNAGKNLYVANRGPDTIGNMWASLSSTSWGYANFPALFDDEGTVTLGGSDTPAARVDGISSNEGIRPTVSVTPDPGSTQPDQDYAWDAYAEWDTSANAWDLVVEWRTDPGDTNDVSALYEVRREPTSRAIKNS
jgi:hypothetical protein